MATASSAIAWLSPLLVSAGALVFAYADWTAALAWLAVAVAAGDAVLWRMGDDWVRQPRRRTRWLLATLVSAALYLVEPVLTHRPAYWVALAGLIAVPTIEFIKFGRPSSQHSMVGRVALLLWLLAAAAHLSWNLGDALAIGAAAVAVYAVEGAATLFISAEPPREVMSIVHLVRQRNASGWSGPASARDRSADRR